MMTKAIGQLPNSQWAITHVTRSPSVGTIPFMTNHHWKMRIRDLLKERGLSMKAASIAAGQGETFVRDILEREREPGIDKFSALATALGVTVGSLLQEGAPLELRIVPLGQEFEPDPDFDRDNGFSAAAPYEPALAGGRPEIDVTPGAGEGTIGNHTAIRIESGGTVTGHQVVAEWVIPTSFLSNNLGASPQGTIFMKVIGDSMTPTLLPDDRIIVDTRQSAFGQDAIYVIDDGDGEPRVKRLEKILLSSPPAVQIVSDNKSHSTQVAPLDQLRVLGRVVGRVSKV